MNKPFFLGNGKKLPSVFQPERLLQQVDRKKQGKSTQLLLGSTANEIDRLVVRRPVTESHFSGLTWQGGWCMHVYSFHGVGFVMFSHWRTYITPIPPPWSTWFGDSDPPTPCLTT